MEYLISYAIFCVCIAILANFTITVPVMQALQRDFISNPLTQSPHLAYLTIFILNILLAPIVALSILFADMDTVRESILRGINKD